MTRAVIARALRGLALVVSCALAAACATRSGPNPSASAPAAPAPDHVAAADTADPGQEKAISSYRDYLARYPDSPEYDGIARRLADLLVEQAADMQLASAVTPDEAARLEGRSTAGLR